ncbi:hypothetical protein [Arthrobacter bambusae]|uniref:hypothetical protein n=1 Tax=Arthrobacter bambusae TaxID=1338426 RepID=UPI00277E5403|nr:hypothetical protein [Arthrobacter bambusae]MDQ0210302.1 hypothetical protein [Arthrobacter bambusae]MDQ0234751.1 hypothetical protein [Arthrobacter bambusae]
MVDWVLLSNLGTALGTTVLAVATFISTRSANRSARLAERALLNGLRPILLPSNWSDAPQKVRFMEGKWMVVRGGHAALEISDNAVYLLMSLRNAGAGVAILHGWHLPPDSRAPLSPVEEFHRLTRDIYVPANDAGFCQVAIRDAESADFRNATAGAAGEGFAVDVLYGDAEGSQRVVSRFFVTPGPAGAGHDDDVDWLLMVSRHWNLDLPAPRG